MLSFIWKERDSNRSRDKEVLLIGVLEYNFSKNCSLDLVKLQAEIWEPVNQEDSTKVIFPGISQNAGFWLHPTLFVLVSERQKS